MSLHSERKPQKESQGIYWGKERVLRRRCIYYKRFILLEVAWHTFPLPLAKSCSSSKSQPGRHHPPGAPSLLSQARLGLPKQAASLPAAQRATTQCLIFFPLFLSVFACQGLTFGIWKFLGYGSNRSPNCWTTPQPQPCKI